MIYDRENFKIKKAYTAFSITPIGKLGENEAMVGFYVADEYGTCVDIRMDKDEVDILIDMLQNGIQAAIDIPERQLTDFERFLYNFDIDQDAP